MSADATPTANQLARSNMLGSLARNRDQYRAAGNADLATLFGNAVERRLQLIEAGEVPVGGVA